MTDDPEVIYEVDVFDEETSRVECGECGLHDYVMDMWRDAQHGDWLCGGCKAAHDADAEDAYRTARGY
jgi:transposase